MSTPDTIPGRSRRDAIPLAPRCAGCDAQLGARFGWCSGCRAAYCIACGRAHFCTPGCPANGCLAGFCVRLVADGTLSETWGLPPE